MTYGQPGNNHVLRKLYNGNLIMDLYPYETFLCNIKIPDGYKWYLHIDLKFEDKNFAANIQNIITTRKLDRINL